MGYLRDRPVADVIVIFLTVTVAAILVATTVVGLILELRQGNDDGTLWKFEGDVIRGFVAIIVGYIAGRGVNGKNGGHSGNP